MMQIHALVVAAGILICGAALSAPQALEQASAGLSLREVLLSTLAHHPKTAALEAKIEQGVAKQLQAEGAFDWQLNHRHQNRTSGYYDGRFAEQSLARQLPFANAKLELGYRHSEGELPVYEQQYLTQDRGEPNVKFKLSLLRNRATDPKRQALQEASLGLAMQQEIQQLKLNELLADAAHAYLDWYLSHQELRVGEELLELAKTRKEGITKRVASGDLAKVVELEFQSTLFSRRATVTELQQKKTLSGLKLSLYQRNEQGEPSDISPELHPIDPEPLMQRLQTAIANLTVDLQQHPSMQALNLREQQLQTQRRLSQTNLLPELDVNVTLARDIGEGSQSLAGNESYVGLKLTAPIERRKAKGKLRGVMAEIKALQSEQRMTREYLTNMMQQQRAQLQNQKQLLNLHIQQAELAKQLAKAEVQRFQVGDSDLFLLNTREIASAQAQLRVAKTFTGILQQKINLLAQSGRLSEFVQGFVSGDFPD